MNTTHTASAANPYPTYFAIYVADKPEPLALCHSRDDAATVATSLGLKEWSVKSITMPREILVSEVPFREHVRARHREIDAAYGNLPADLSDEKLTRHLLAVAWWSINELFEIGPQTIMVWTLLKDACKSLVPERPGDATMAVAMRKILRKEQ